MYSGSDLTKLHHLDDETQVGLNPTHVQGFDYINASFVQVRTWYNLGQP